MPEARWAIPCFITSQLLLWLYTPIILYNTGTEGMHTEAATFSETRHETCGH